MRLIDADAYKKYCENMGIPFYDAVDFMPTIKAVQVVRCRECRWYEYGTTCIRNGIRISRKPEDYCSRGKV